MQYMNGHAPQIGDIIEVPSTGQRLTVTGIPQAGIVSCGNANLRSNGCALLSRETNSRDNPNRYNQSRPDNFNNYGVGYIDPGLSLVEDLMIMDTVMDVAADMFDIAADIAIMDDFGGGW